MGIEINFEGYVFLRLRQHDTLSEKMTNVLKKGVYSQIALIQSPLS